MKHDYRYWTSDGVDSDQAMWEVGKRDYGILTENIQTSGVALEIGCGPGRLLRPASEHFQKVIGIDCSEEALSRAAELLDGVENVELVLTSGLDFKPVESNAVDFVFSFAALFSMPTSAFASSIAETSRVLKLGGKASLQLYLGQEATKDKEDTLGIRTYQNDRFARFVETLGFKILSSERLVLPFEVSNEAEGSIATVVKLEKVAEASQADIQILVSSDEAESGYQYDGSFTEYQMALARAKQHMEVGAIEDAIQALEFATQNYKSPESEVVSLLEVLKIQNQGNFGKSDILEKNLRALRDKFPKVAAIVERTSVPDFITEVTAGNGEPVLSYKGVLLDNASRPKEAAKVWAQRQKASVREFDSAVVLGFSLGYHLEALLEAGLENLIVVEPNPAVLKAACGLRDLTKLFSHLEGLEISSRLKDVRELFIHPQTRQVQADAISDFRRNYFASKGLANLRPNIGVVGPIYGGTLPMYHSAIRTLNGVGQRTEGFDYSKFSDSYNAIGDFFSSPNKLSAGRDSLVEMLSSLCLERISERPIDILICLAQAPISPKALTEIRKRGIITALWFVEDCGRFPAWRFLAEHFDYVFTIQKEPWLSMVEKAGAGKAIYLPSACDPQVHKPLILSSEDKKRFGSKVSFVGAGYNNRRHVFAELSSLDFKIWGTEWPAVVPFNRLVQEGARRLSVDEYVKIFNASDINLNLHSSSERDGVDPKGDFINPRTFELAASGAFQLVDNRTLLPELFSDKELVTFGSPREMKEQINHFLEHPEEREAYVKRARARVLSDHTYENRLQEMLGYIYADHYEALKSKEKSDPWEGVLDLAKKTPELHTLLSQARESGCGASIEDIVTKKIRTGAGSLSEVEQKLLFIHNFASQVINVETKRRGLKN